MRVSRLKIAEVIGDKTLSSFEPKKLAKEVAAYLLNEGRTHELDSLVRDIVDYRAKHGLVEADVSAAHDLSKELKDEVSALVRKLKTNPKKVVLNVEQIPSLIGGIKINLANEQLDLSIRAKLNQFRRLAVTKGRV